MAAFIECNLLGAYLLQCRPSFVEAEPPYFVTFSTGFGVIFEYEYVTTTVVRTVLYQVLLYVAKVRCLRAACKRYQVLALDGKHLLPL